MKRPSSFSGFRWFLILSLIAGVLLASLAILPFETIAGWLNGLASDGNFESFTVERHQVLSRLAGFLGLILILVPGGALLWWVRTQRMLASWGNWGRGFKQSLGEDMRVFFNGLSLSAWSRTDQRLMMGLMLVALIVRLANLNLPLTHDEAYTYNAFSSRSLWVTISDYHLPNNHVFLTVIINILTHLFGNHLWLIRLPTIVVGILMVPATCVLGRRLYGRETGLLAAAFVTVFPVLVEYSVLARGYIIVSLFTLLILILGDRLREGKNRFLWLVLIVINALGFFTIPIMLFPFGALYIWLFLSCIVGDISGYRSKLDFLKYWLVSGFASAFLTVLLYAPILITNPGNFFGNSFVAPVKKRLFAEVFWSRMGVAWAEWTQNIPVGLVVLGVAGFGLSVLLHWKISRHKIPLQWTFFLWLAAYLIARRPDMMTRMWLFLAAPVLIWSAGGMVETLRWISGLFRKRLPLVELFLNVSLAGIFLYGAWTVPTIPERWKEKSTVESAALYFKDTLREGDLVTASVEFFPELRYYFGVYGIDQEYLRKSGYFQRAFIVIGSQRHEALDEVVPMIGINSNRPAVDMDALVVVRLFNDMVIYEGKPVP